MLGSSSSKTIALLIILCLGFFLVIGCDPPRPNTYTLTVQVEGQGSVDPEVGDHEYEEDAVVELTATPSEGWEFKEWVGEVADTESMYTTLVMDKNTTVKAVFEEISMIYYALTIETKGEGSVLAAPDPGDEGYEEGMEVTLAAIPEEEEGWEFSRWEGDLEGSSNPIEITMDSHKTVIAVFEEMIPEIEVVNAVNGTIGVVFIDDLKEEPRLSDFTAQYEVMNSPNEMQLPVQPGPSDQRDGLKEPFTRAADYEALSLTGVTWNGANAVTLTFEPFEQKTVDKSYRVSVCYLGGDFIAAEDVFIVPAANPTLVSITPVDHVEVAYNTSKEEAIAALADSTTITDSADNERTVELTWSIDGYDGTVAGEYVAIGAFELPEGVDQPEPPTDLEVIAVVTVKNPTIVSITPVDHVEVAYNTSKEEAIAALADSTTITDSADDTHTVSLSWSIADYNGEVAGPYTATGIFNLPSGVEQSDPETLLEVTATVTVGSLQEQQLFTLTISTWGNGTVSPPSGQRYPEDELVTITVMPEAGWYFWEWSGADAQYITPTGGHTYTIGMSKDMEITANFGLDYDDFGGGTRALWNRQAKGQPQGCGECIWYWPDNRNWHQSLVLGPCPCGANESAVLQPSNWTIDEAPDDGLHNVYIGFGFTVDLDRSAEVRSLANVGQLETVTGRHLKISRGFVRNAGSIVLSINSHLDVSQGAGLENQGYIELADGAKITLAGPMVNDGTVHMEGPQARGTWLLLDGDVHLIGDGRINLTKEFFVRVDSQDGHRLVNDENVIHGCGEIGWTNMALTNRGRIEADIPGEVLTVRPGATLSPSLNEGLLLATNEGTLRLSGNAGGALTNIWGTIRANDNSHVRLAEGITITGGLLETEGSGRFYTPLDATAGLVDVTLTGRLDIGHGTTLRLAGTIDNQGYIDMPAQTGRGTSLQIVEDTILTGGGTIHMGDQFFGRIRAAVDAFDVMVLTLGDQTISGEGQLGQETLAIINEGAIMATNPGRMLRVRPASGERLTNAGVVSAAAGAVVNVEGDYRQESVGELQITIGIVDDNVKYGQLIVSGISELDGSLTISLGEGFIPEIGDEFHILDLDFEETSGAFALDNLPPLDIGQWDVSDLLLFGILRVVE